MAVKTKTKEVSMEEALWKSADKLRGSVEPSEYKHVVLSLFFLKFASDKFEAQRAKIIADSMEKFVDKTVDLVYTKYMKALIFYEGIQRVEQFMFHQDAFCEILLNAIAHKDYSSCNPIQISVYEDKIYIWNDGEMPSELDSTDKLFMKHSSKPYNPKLAGVFFKSGMIEAWGRGFDKIKEACAKYDGPLPEYAISASGIMVLCKACDKYLELLRDDGYHDQNGYDVVMIKAIEAYYRKNILNRIGIYANVQKRKNCEINNKQKEKNNDTRREKRGFNEVRTNRGTGRVVSAIR